ncbi:MAG: ABC transporter ATP-binding protein [Nitriliruptorales bacterium]
MLELRRVQSAYGGTRVLRGVDLALESGRRIAVLGRNGAGKTTLLRTIIGLVPLAGGSMTFDGQDLSTLPVHERAHRGIGYVPQGRQVFPDLSVADNLLAAAYGVGASDADTRLASVLAEFPALRDKHAARAGSLSGGQQQMLAVGRALMSQPRLLLLDEPSEGIQPSIVDQIGDKILQLNEEWGITVLLVEQNLEFAAAVVEDAYILDMGEVARQLPAADVLEDIDLQREYMGV